MRVSLVDYTGSGSNDPARHAANVLVFTKSTRLKMVPDLMKEIVAMPWSEIEKELDYMSKTIPSSHEFIHYTFLINGVSRGFTHQAVRTRTASWAQQTMRVLDVDGWDYHTGPTVASDPDSTECYDTTMKAIDTAYRQMIDNGAKIEDARGVLPTNILTNIVGSFNLRTLSETLRKRASSRTQGEYRDVMTAMRAEVIKAHPWAEMFLERTFDKAAAELEHELLDILTQPDDKIRLVKLIDQMRMTA